jgi:hypothetical protein
MGAKQKTIGGRGWPEAIDRRVWHGCELKRRSEEG